VPLLILSSSDVTLLLNQVNDAIGNKKIGTTETVTSESCYEGPNAREDKISKYIIKFKHL